MKRTETVKAFFDALDANRPEEAKVYLAEGFETTGPTPEPMNADQYFGMFKGARAAFEPFTHNMGDLREEGDKTVCNISITGTHTGTMELPGMPPIPATHKSIQMSKTEVVCQFEGDKIKRMDSDTSKGGGMDEIFGQLGIQIPTPQ